MAPDAGARPFRQACVIGLGVVGIPVAAKLAESGLKTIGLDVDQARVDAIAAGRYPFASEEPGLPALVERLVGNGTLTATTSPEEALAGSDAVIVVVQTPLDDDGVPRYENLKAAIADVGDHLAEGDLVVVESTIAPGTMASVVRPILEERSGLVAGKDFHLGHCPERVMPGRLLQNIVGYDRVVGGFDEASTERMCALYERFVRAGLHRTRMTTAEVVKTAENGYRDVQIAFANEVARIAQHQGVDVWEVRELVNMVEGRNMHLPGVGVGGHCIPKDGLLLAYGAHGSGFEPRILRAAREVNESMPEATAGVVAAACDGLVDKVVVVLGASYLPGTDDTRHTPSVPLVAALRGAGAEVRLVDPYVEALEDETVGGDVEAALEGADAVVLSTAHQAYVRPPWEAWGGRMRTRVAVDGRGVWDPTAARAAGFLFGGVGRPLSR